MKRPRPCVGLCLLVLLLPGCGDPQPPPAPPTPPPPTTPGLSPPDPATGGLEGTSLLGRELISRPDDGGIAEADRALEEAPEDVDLIIAAGIARAGRWQYSGAIELYDRGLGLAPDNPWLYRHRGHRYISLRRFPEAVRDLGYAAALDSLSFDILYHLGLAHYLSGDFERAADVYRQCLAYGEDPAMLELEASGALGEGYRSCVEAALVDDTRVALADWLYRALRRAGRDDEAAELLESITEGMEVEANRSYYLALLFYRGLRSEDEILDRRELTGNQLQTIGYGVANWHLVEGDTVRARALLEEIVQGEEWPAFGMIAAEVDLSRLQGR
jgi:tetratricopeptide (TPR) repeat protein